MDSFPDRLRTAIDNRGIKQIDLASIVGVPRGAISNYLKGRYKPNGETMAQLANVLNVSPSWLAGLDDDVGSRKEDELMRQVAESMRGLDDRRLVLLLAYIKLLRGDNESS